MATELYDMIVMAGEEHGRLRQAVLGDLLLPNVSLAKRSASAG